MEWEGGFFSSSHVNMYMPTLFVVSTYYLKSIKFEIQSLYIKCIFWVWYDIHTYTHGSMSSKNEFQFSFTDYKFKRDTFVVKSGKLGFNVHFIYVLKKVFHYFQFLWKGNEWRHLSNKLGTCNMFSFSFYYPFFVPSTVNGMNSSKQFKTWLLTWLIIFKNFFGFYLQTEINTWLLSHRFLLRQLPMTSHHLLGLVIVISSLFTRL